ncbi:thioredoxin-disulfide reductase [Paenibacillus albidus]|uniref:Thioredoxin-disulfide reductase n=1 Tax=Paenibacillus albidus TaxID=2041023 RepID=A0A917D2Z9_9BACL|nr:NAD(P)/FAD-dependent oxidoreductase [Paenibacillus albidus]GGG08708.1 thioredoxin-disulfide reductase [Paenibacillus albidus]
MIYDTIIVGGGLAGLQAAIQLGRYSAHHVLVIDAGEGRSSLCRKYHNILGWPDGISGQELRDRGRRQAESTGVQFVTDRIVLAEKQEELFRLEGEQGKTYQARTLLLATGIMDRFPELPGIINALGNTIYVCPDCDGYEIQNLKTVLLGSGDVGAAMAFILRERTDDLTYINHEQKPLSQDNRRRLDSEGIHYIEAPAAYIQEQEGRIQGIALNKGTFIPAERGFIAFGGNPVHSGLAEQLGAKLHKNRHIEADSRSLMTSVEHVWVAGDVAVHAEQATVAMGDGAIAGIWIHKALRKMKELEPAAVQRK